MPTTMSTKYNHRITRAVIPAAGLGTRLKPLSDAIPKEMLPVGRKPVLAYILEELYGAGIRDALFIISDKKPQIRSFFGDEYCIQANTDKIISCQYVTQEEQHGLGDAILRAEKWVDDDPFVVAFGDCIIEAPVPSDPMRRMIDTFVDQKCGAAVICEAVSWRNVSRYGVLSPEIKLNEYPDRPFAVADIVEKPTQESAPSNLVVAARYVLSPLIFELLHKSGRDVRGELNVTDSVRAMRMLGSPLWAVPLLKGESRRDIGNFESFFNAFIQTAMNDPEFGASARKAAEDTLSEFSK